MKYIICIEILLARHDNPMDSPILWKKYGLLPKVHWLSVELIINFKLIEFVAFFKLRPTRKFKEKSAPWKNLNTLFGLIFLENMRL